MKFFQNSKLKEKLFLQPGRESAASDLIYAVGDIHGRHDLLTSMMTLISDDIKAGNAIKADDSITIVFLGDYIDRGYQSKDVLETLCAADLHGANQVFLKGNHEAAMLDYIDDPVSGANWLKYGGKETLSSYGVQLSGKGLARAHSPDIHKKLLKAVPDRHLAFIRSMPSYWIEGKYMFVHAGVDPGTPVEDQSDDEYLWIRDEFLHSIKKLPYIIVHGHTPEPKPVWDGRRIGIDTGAYISNKLTAVRLRNGDVDFLST